MSPLVTVCVLYVTDGEDTLPPLFVLFPPAGERGIWITSPTNSEGLFVALFAVSMESRLIPYFCDIVQ